jgi:uncharacterized pyridoxamine 5'-phosphate oxidase family protein
MYKQMKANPKVEFCAMGADNKTLRIFGKVAFDDGHEAKVKALETSPVLQGMYKPDDGIFTLFYFESAKAVISEMGGNAREFNL